LTRSATKLFGIVGASGSGKTTLITALLREFRRRGLSISTIKHAHHGFDMDRPGKDSWRHREAGAAQVMVASNNGWALLQTESAEDEISPAKLAQHMIAVDLILVEGFKEYEIPRIEVHRPSVGKKPFFPNDAGILGVASDEVIETYGRPLLQLSNISAIADFILEKRV
jgi:molybdopterin-guanine dinucleotide biosynthesis protein B